MERYSMQAFASQRPNDFGARTDGPDNSIRLPSGNLIIKNLCELSAITCTRNANCHLPWATSFTWIKMAFSATKIKQTPRFCFLQRKVSFHIYSKTCIVTHFESSILHWNFALKFKKKLTEFPVADQLAFDQHGYSFHSLIYNMMKSSISSGAVLWHWTLWKLDLKDPSLPLWNL